MNLIHKLAQQLEISVTPGKKASNLTKTKHGSTETVDDNSTESWCESSSKSASGVIDGLKVLG